MSPAPNPGSQRPLIVRLRNWVGDVVLCLPALQHLQAHGFSLHLIGKRWAPDLLRACGWPVEVLAGGSALRQRQLRDLREQCLAVDRGFNGRLNTVVFPFSLSSAWEARRAGLRALGYRAEGRSLLLHRALAMPEQGHEIERYWRLATAVTAAAAEPVPPRLHLPVDDAARAEAQQRLRQAGVRGAYSLLCPFGGGPIDGHDKHWPGFAQFAKELQRAGHALVLCPGPDEMALARRDYDGLHLLPDLGLSAYAAVMAGAQRMVSNDTGPGHMAAAVGTPLVSVLGPTPAWKWRPWGPDVSVVSGWPQWPAVDAVLSAFEAQKLRL